MLDSEKDEKYPPTHLNYWNTSDHYLMGNVTPGGIQLDYAYGLVNLCNLDMRAIIQSQEQGSAGGGNTSHIDVICMLMEVAKVPPASTS